jgi:tRNA A37 threonylcarbamoyladenosine modification protein TsaB
MAWGKAFDRPVRGVSVLEAIANKARPTTDWAFPIMDARRGEFFISGFRPSPAASSAEAAQNYEPTDEGWLFKPEPLQAFIAGRLAGGESATCLVRACDKAAVNLRANMPAPLKWLQVEGILVDSIAEIALNEEKSSHSHPAAKLDAFYLRRPDAELNWKE